MRLTCTLHHTPVHLSVVVAEKWMDSGRIVLCYLSSQMFISLLQQNCGGSTGYHSGSVILIINVIVQLRIHQNRWIKIQKTRVYRVILNLKRSGENSLPSVCCFLLLINTFLLVFVNIFLQLEANPVQMRLLYFYPAVFGEFETGALRMVRQEFTSFLNMLQTLKHSN